MFVRPQPADTVLTVSQPRFMKTAETDILIHAGLSGGSDDHWYARWEAKLATARRIEQADWSEPDRKVWVSSLVEQVGQAEKPVVLIGHSFGVMTIVHAASKLSAMDVRGAFLAAPIDLEAHLDAYPQFRSFLPVPRDPLPFPSFLIASRTDPFIDFETADEFAAAWGSAIYDAGDCGHLNADSGHGPWPEGLLMFARLLKQL